MVTSDFRPEVYTAMSACAMHLGIIIGTVRSLCTWIIIIIIIMRTFV